SRARIRRISVGRLAEHHHRRGGGRLASAQVDAKGGDVVRADRHNRRGGAPIISAAASAPIAKSSTITDTAALRASPAARSIAGAADPHHRAEHAQEHAAGPDPA
ncbi:MAG TPA: hypothetical protein VN253_14340, partial [Kofleriaceae bacterium]|nr:hypothetical protein [Kofleriaceae bacterium]